MVDEQLIPYLATLSVFALSMIIWRFYNGTELSADMVRTTLFTTTSLITSTGFVVSDYSQWGGATHVAFFLMAFIGGCCGSAAGGIKIFRWQVLAAAAKVHIQQMIYPHRVMPIDFNGRRVTDPLIEAVLAFFTIYILTFAVHAAILAALGLDLISALSGSAAALGNVGRGVGETIGSSGNWQSVPKAAKWLLSFEMIVGRLELFPVFILFTPSFWKE
jgi:trk system potassium uptake protein TrkH